MAASDSTSPITPQFWERYKAACRDRGLPADDQNIYAWMDTEYLDFRIKCIVYRNNKKLRAEVAALYQGAA